MKIIDFTSKLPKGEGYNVHYKNPDFWDGTVRECDYFITDSDKIRAAHLAHGIPEYDGRFHKYKEIKHAPRQEKEEDAPEAQEAVETPKSWNELRALAKTLTDEPVKSKEQALQIIEANRGADS